MASVVIVEVQEVCKGFNAFGLGVVGTDVGPLLEHGAVEPFDFPIGLGSVGSGPSVLHVLTQGVTEVETSITAAVVGEDFSHLGSVLGEPVPGA